MPARLPITVGTEVDADILNEISGVSDSASYLLTTALNPLTTTANTYTSILSGSYSFTSGYAYEISVSTRYTITGTPTATQEPMAFFGVLRATTSGTQIYNSGYISPPASATNAHFAGTQMVKCTAGDTTQTLVFCAQFSTVASASAMAITPNGAVSPARMTIKRIGLAANHIDALEIPTA